APMPATLPRQCAHPGPALQTLLNRHSRTDHTDVADTHSCHPLRHLPTRLYVPCAPCANEKMYLSSVRYQPALPLHPVHQSRSPTGNAKMNYHHSPPPHTPPERTLSRARLHRRSSRSPFYICSATRLRRSHLSQRKKYSSHA